MTKKERLVDELVQLVRENSGEGTEGRYISAFQSVRWQISEKVREIVAADDEEKNSDASCFGQKGLPLEPPNFVETVHPDHDHLPLHVD